MVPAADGDERVIYSEKEKKWVERDFAASFAGSADGNGEGMYTGAGPIRCRWLRTEVAARFRPTINPWLLYYNNF